MLRESVSAAPPAPTVTRSRTGRCGHDAADWAKAGAAANTATEKTARATTQRVTRRANGMAIPPQEPNAFDFSLEGSDRRNRPQWAVYALTLSATRAGAAARAGSAR